MTSSGINKDFPVEVRGFEFSAHIFAILLEGFDIVLGIRWLQQLGKILWYFTIREMKFTVNGRNIKWFGDSTDTTSLAVLTKNNSLEPNLEKLLDDFEDIFKTLQGMPPFKSCDHRIRLKVDTELVAIRPYQ